MRSGKDDDDDNNNDDNNDDDDDNDNDRIPTEMWRDDVLCKDNPVTFMYAIYPCYSNYAPLRRNPVEIDSQKFVLDSKVTRATNEPSREDFTITEKAPTRAFSWLK